MAFWHTYSSSPSFMPLFTWIASAHMAISVRINVSIYVILSPTVFVFLFGISTVEQFSHLIASHCCCLLYVIWSSYLFISYFLEDSRWTRSHSIVTHTEPVWYGAASKSCFILLIAQVIVFRNRTPFIHICYANQPGQIRLVSYKAFTSYWTYFLLHFNYHIHVMHRVSFSYPNSLIISTVFSKLASVMYHKWKQRGHNFFNKPTFQSSWLIFFKGGLQWNQTCNWLLLVLVCLHLRHA